MKILLLEDEYSLRKSVKEVLDDEGYTVDDYGDGDKAMDAIFENTYDLLLLDVNVPGTNGLELLRQLKKSDIHIPTLFVTSMTEMDHLEQGYDAGCCDYIKKPFDMLELKLRVASALKVSALKAVKASIPLPGGYEYDTKRFTLMHNNEEVKLSKTEKMMLELFIKHKNQVVTPDMIREYVWDDYVDPANIRVQINNLRKKLDNDLIVNVRGLGYKLES